MTTDDLPPPVSLDALRACVPGGHIPLWVEHEDGVVPNRLDQKTKHLLALADSLFVLATLGEISGDLRESDQRAAGVVKRSDDGVDPESLAVLADPPPFIFYSAYGCGCLELSPRLPGGNVVLGVKNGKDPADHFRFRIAEDSCRPTIPGADAAV